MDYMRLVRRSIANAWNYRFLWFFGFFVAITDGFGGLHLWDERIEKFDRFERLGRLGDWHIDFDPALLIMLGLMAFALWVLFWAMSVLSEGSLIHGISKKEMNQATGFSDCWSAGINSFLRLFGIILLITLLMVFIIFGTILFMVPAYILSVALGLVLTIFILPVILIIVIVGVSVEGWAIRYAVLHDDSWLEAIKNGWLLFKNNIWKTIAIALLSFFTQLILWCFLVVGIIVLALPFIIMAFVNFWLGLAPGVMIVLAVTIFSSAFFGTFASSIWTLGFRELTGDTVPQATAVD
jgi:hypothetical protein